MQMMDDDAATPSAHTTTTDAITGVVGMNPTEELNPGQFDGKAGKRAHSDRGCDNDNAIDEF